METEAKFEYRGLDVKARFAYNSESRRTRVVAFVDDAPDDWMTTRAPTVVDFPYLAYLDYPTTHTRRGDFTEVDRAWDAHNREIVARKREILDAALRALKIYSADGLEIKFSRKAGCSCGCSPGFIIDGLPRFARHNLFVSHKPAGELTVHRATLV